MFVRSKLCMKVPLTDMNKLVWYVRNRSGVYKLYRSCSLTLSSVFCQEFIDVWFKLNAAQYFDEHDF